MFFAGKSTAVAESLKDLELDLMILLNPFQLEIFYDCVIL